MGDLTSPEYVTRADGLRLAFRRVKGRGPTLVFLPGFKSDMRGSKALALEAWAIRTGRACLRFDYAGCGESEGAFEDQTLASWRDDALVVVEALERGPVLLVGSSMGGWLMLHVALALGSQVAGLVGIAAAPDFTDWGYSSEEKGRIEKYGRLEQESDYADEPTVTTQALWQSGQALRVLSGEIALTCPVHLLQGQQDPDVPWEAALRLAARLRSADVQTLLIKDGDHRLSRPSDIALMLRTVEALLESL
jgi:pimeloyl-ACP methyl ester carboxylesterase